MISCDLVIDNATKHHRRYGFLEYDTVAAANEACVSMNIFDLGGKFLRVGKAIAPKELSLQNVPSIPIRAYNAVPLPSSHSPAQISTQSVLKKSKFLPPPVQTVMPAPEVLKPIVNKCTAPTNNVPPLSIQTQQYGGSPSPSSQKNAPQPHRPIPPPKPYPLPVPPPGMVVRPPIPHQAYQSYYGCNGGRHLMLNKLMRKESETCTMVLLNMVNPDQVITVIISIY